MLTRLFGATFGDLLTKAHVDGGLGLGTVGASLLLAVILAVFVARSVMQLNRQLPERAYVDQVYRQ